METARKPDPALTDHTSPSTDQVPPTIGESLVISTGPVTLQVRDSLLIVPPFRLRKHSQTFINPVELTIDLRSVRPGRYQLVAVHNFQLEDRNPNLNQCLGGVFLAARRADGAWEEAEAQPVECRTLEVLGYVKVEPETARAPDDAL